MRVDRSAISRGCVLGTGARVRGVRGWREDVESAGRGEGGGEGRGEGDGMGWKARNTQAESGREMRTEERERKGTDSGGKGKRRLWGCRCMWQGSGG